MRFTFIAFGTRGDVTPLVALAVSLQSHGHRIRLVSHPEFEPLARQYDLAFHPVAGSFQALLATAEGRRALGVPTNTPRGLSGLMSSFRDDPEAVYHDAWQAAADADGIVCSAVAIHVAALVAFYRDVPIALGLPVPSTPTRRLPHSAMPPWPLGGLYNRLSYAAADRLIARGASEIFAAWQREARRLGGARPPAPLRLTTLVGVSPLLVPRPDDWPASAHVTGFWHLPYQPAEPSDALHSFVTRGEPPVCLGFGSMADNEPAGLRAIVSEALARAGVRAVVVTGSGGAVGGVGESILEVPYADYEWLFPRMRAVIHQGGVGTASFCLRAGVPQVTVAYCLDHRFWAWRLRELGVAPPGLRRHRLTAASLSAAIRLVLDDAGYGRRAVAIAPQVRAEDGLGRATRILAAHFGFTPPPGDENTRTPRR